MKKTTYYLNKNKGDKIMKDLSKYPNIDREIEKQLNAVGIFTITELQVLGAEKAWLKIKKNTPSSCFQKLLALEGAIQRVNKTSIDPLRKKELTIFYKLNSIICFETK